MTQWEFEYNANIIRQITLFLYVNYLKGLFYSKDQQTKKEVSVTILICLYIFFYPTGYPLRNICHDLFQFLFVCHFVRFLEQGSDPCSRKQTKCSVSIVFSFIE